MREVQYLAPDGRIFFVLLPDGAPDGEAYRGMPLGPPRLVLDWPEAMAVRLHNELGYRRVFTADDARRRPGDILSAITAAVRADVGLIAAQYVVGGIDDLPPPE
jgi:hypothetical protein